MKKIINRVRRWFLGHEALEIAIYITAVIGILVGVSLLALLVLGLCGVIPFNAKTSDFNTVQWVGNPANPASPVHHILFQRLS